MDPPLNALAAAVVAGLGTWWLGHGLLFKPFAAWALMDLLRLAATVACGCLSLLLAALTPDLLAIAWRDLRTHRGSAGHSSQHLSRSP